MFELDCPNCGHHLRIHEGYAGQRGKCRHCLAPIEVPEASKAPEPETPKPETPEASKAPEPETPELGAGGFARTPDEHTGLAALDTADDRTPPPVPEASAEEFKKLGCLYWLLAILFPPGALIWGIVLPKGHPQRKMGILVPIVFMAIAVIFVLIIGALAVSSLALIGQGLSEFEHEVTVSTPESPPPPSGALIPIGAPIKNLPVFPGMNLVEANVRVPDNDPLANMDPGLRTSLSGVASAEYETVYNYFKEGFKDTGWKLVSSGIMRAPEQSASISAYNEDQTIWVGMKPEGSGTRVNIAVGPLSPPQ